MPPRKGEFIEDGNFDRMMGSLQAKVEKLEDDLSAMQGDIREIRDTITGVKGSWKALLAIGSILSGVLVTVGIKIWDIFTSTGIVK